jgi:hypothetical protein
MWKCVALLAFSAGLAACAGEPRVVSSDSFQVSIAFDGSDAGLTKADELAREKCGRGARSPVRTSVARVAEGPVAYYSCKLGD